MIKNGKQNDEAQQLMSAKVHLRQHSTNTYISLFNRNDVLSIIILNLHIYIYIYIY